MTSFIEEPPSIWSCHYKQHFTLQDTSVEKKDSPVVEKQQKEKSDTESKKKTNSGADKSSKVSAEPNEHKVASGNNSNKKKPNKESKKRKFEVEAEYSMSNERLKAYGLNPKKLKKKLFNQKINTPNE